jgi:hypothetical protein
MDPDVVTNFLQSDHRKLKFELLHGIKLGQVFYITESDIKFSKNICDRCVSHKIPYFLILNQVYSRSSSVLMFYCILEK